MGGIDRVENNAICALDGELKKFEDEVNKFTGDNNSKGMEEKKSATEKQPAATSIKKGKKEKGSSMDQDVDVDGLKFEGRK